jgi:general nucleoside transport system ATP-binding protein
LEPVIEMLNITKRFPGIVANDDISISLKKGEIHALLGENGAGKSTLVSILFGMYKPDNGIIKKNGKVVHIHNPNDANNLGIGMVHQHFKLVDVFTVVDNILLGFESRKFGFLDRKKAKERITELSKRYGLAVNIKAKIEDISVGMQQRVEILKMLYRNNDILIFDEPTAVLTPQEIVELMKIMRGLTKEGKSILFITHKLNEIMAVADRVTVLRKGKHIGTVNVKETNKEQLSNMMVGRSVEFAVKKKPMKPENVALSVQNLNYIDFKTRKHLLKDVSFNVHKGEILGIAGIEGNGQSELAYAITGLLKPSSGQILLNDRPIERRSIRFRNDNGLSHIPEDRHKYGLILDYPLSYNLLLKKYHKHPFTKYGLISYSTISKHGEKLVELFDVRTSQGGATLARSMSGGNQQKAIIAREIDTDSDVLIAVQLTRGLDVGAIEYIYKRIVEQRDRGKAVLLISLELDEVLDLSDRIHVMYEGEIVANLDPKMTNPAEVGLYMSGSKSERKHLTEQGQT